MTPLRLPVLGINRQRTHIKLKRAESPSSASGNIFGNKTLPAPGRKVSLAELCGWIGCEGVKPCGWFPNPLPARGRGCWVYIYWSYTGGELDSQPQHMTVTQELCCCSRAHPDLGEGTFVFPVTSQPQTFAFPVTSLPQTFVFPVTSQPHWHSHSSSSPWTPAQSINLSGGMWQSK